MHNVHLKHAPSVLLLLALVAVLSACSSSGSSSGAPRTTEPVREPTDIVAIARAAGCEHPEFSPDTGDTLPGPYAVVANPIKNVQCELPPSGSVLDVSTYSPDAMRTKPRAGYKRPADSLAPGQANGGGR